MSLWSRGESMLRNLLQRKKVETQLDEELQTYLSLLTDGKKARGVQPEQARRMALIEVGGMTQVKQAVRDSRGGSSLESLSRTSDLDGAC